MAKKKMKDFVEMFNREFGEPFISAGKVYAKLKDDGTVTIQIGRRDVHIDENFDVLGAGTMMVKDWWRNEFNDEDEEIVDEEPVN